MKLHLITSLFLIIGFFCASSSGQQKRRVTTTKAKATLAQKSAEIGQTAVVVDETLAVLRKNPTLFSESVHRMSRGRLVQIVGTAEADGVKFYRVTVPPRSFGWVQADAVFGKFRGGDEARFAALVQALNGFDQIEAAVEFLKFYPAAASRPAILLLFGDLVEDLCTKLSTDATRRLKRLEMTASGAPLHSYYLNVVSLDRYRKLGIVFLFNSAARQFHYEGASWREIVTKFPNSPEAVEAQKRLDALKVKMEKTSAK